jgi:hypothetical protein
MKKTLMALFLWAFYASLPAAGAAGDEAWLNYGYKLLTQKQFENSIIAFEKALQFNHYNYRAFYYEAKAYDGLDEKIEATDCAKMAYALNPAGELKDYAEKLEERAYGPGVLLFYPFTFEVFYLFNWFSQPGFGATVTYSFNSWLAVKTGALYVASRGIADISNMSSYADYSAYYLDVPFAVKLKFKLPWNENFFWNGLAAGGYFGVNTGGRFTSTYPEFANANLNFMDFGAYVNLEQYYVFKPIAFTANLIFEYSLPEIFPGTGDHMMNFILALGMGF